MEGLMLAEKHRHDKTIIIIIIEGYHIFQSRKFIENELRQTQVLSWYKLIYKYCWYNYGNSATAAGFGYLQ